MVPLTSSVATLAMTWLLALAGNAQALSSKQQQLSKPAPPGRFPLSYKAAALIAKAKDLDPGLRSDTRSRGRYFSVGWSNRLGTVLTPVAVLENDENEETAAACVYTADRPFYWNKIDVGCRMTVVQLPNQKDDTFDLWVHSPVELDDELRASLAKLGTVKYVVSPNYEHLKYAHQWSVEYPDAYMWGCPGLMEKLPDIEWEGEILVSALNKKKNQDNFEAHDDKSPSYKNCWDFNTIVPLHVDCEVNPFTGKPFFNEVIFYHQPSKSLITTDLYWNYPQNNGIPNSHLSSSNDSGPWELAPSVEKVPIGSKLWKQGMDKIYKPFYQKYMVQNKDRYSEMVDVILNEWDIETLVPAHGDLVRGRDVAPVLRDHLLL